MRVDICRIGLAIDPAMPPTESGIAARAVVSLFARVLGAGCCASIFSPSDVLSASVTRAALQSVSRAG